jgi:AraC-like DNA-binding protein
MFDSKINVVVVESEGYGSIVAHSHEFVELVYVVSGEGENNIGNKRIPVKSGDIFMIADRETRHSLCPIGDPSSFLIINIIFPYDFYKFNYALLSPEHVFTAEMVPNAKQLVEQIQEEYVAKRWQYEEVTYSLTKVLLTQLFRCLPTHRAKRKNVSTSRKQVNEYIETAVQYIHQNFEKQIDVDDVAAACGLCKQYLQRLFKRERDTSIVAFIIKYRIEQSCRYLLNTDYPVVKVAQLVGFNDLKYFYSKFKEIVGYTPIQYKQKFGGNK